MSQVRGAFSCKYFVIIFTKQVGFLVIVPKNPSRKGKLRVQNLNKIFAKHVNKHVSKY